MLSGDPRWQTPGVGLFSAVVEVKTPPQRVIYGNCVSRFFRVRLARDNVDMSDAPETLGDRGRDAWDRANGVTGGDPRLAPAVLQFARAVDDAEGARSEWIAAGRPFLITKPSGRLAVHPLVEVTRMMETRVLRSATELGMTPASAAPRRRPGRPLGAVSAPDRRAPIRAI